MDVLVCALGEPGEERFVPQVAEYVDGFELQNYVRKGVQSEEDWREVVAQHERLIERLPGRLAVHGPFLGIEYGYADHLLREMGVIDHSGAKLAAD